MVAVEPRLELRAAFLESGAMNLCTSMGTGEGRSGEVSASLRTPTAMRRLN